MHVIDRSNYRVGICGLLATVLIACSSGEEGASPTEEQLRSCTTDDRGWSRAIARARADKTLPELQALAEEVAAACPARWQPLWTAGESLFRQAPKAPVEVFEEMRELWGGALERARAADDDAGVAISTFRIGVYHKRVSDLDTAEAVILTGLEAAERVDRPDLLANGYNALAGVYRTGGRLAETIEALEQSSVHLEHAGRSKDARRLDYNRSLVLEDVGQLSEQRRLLEQVYRDSLAAGDEQRLHRVCVAMGNHFLLHDELDTAREWYERVPDGSDQAPNAALGRGRAELRAGRPEEAIRQLERALVDDLSIRFKLYPRTFLGEALLRKGDLAGAREQLSGVIADADRIASREISGMARSLYGKALAEDPEQLGEAIRWLREALEFVEGTGEGLDPAAGGMTFLRERSEPFADLTAVLALRHGKEQAGEILAIVERAHARSLRQILGSEGRSIEAAELEEIQRSLEPDELMLDYLVGRDRGTLIAIGAHDVSVHVIPGWRTLRKPLRRYLSALKRPLISQEARSNPRADLERDLETGRHLRRQLLDPVGERLTSARRVYLVPDQDLALLPFAALPLDGPEQRFVGERIEMAVLPMAGSHRRPRGEVARILVAGDPVPDADGEFPELPLASEEISRVLAVWNDVSATALRRDELSVDRLGELQLSDYDLLHFATHAVASSRDPDQCAVILSEGRRLGLRRITELELGPTLVVLSACQTGEGEVIPGEGVVGLTWAFLSAGARAVVASLWSVEDSATTELMVAFHRHLRNGEDGVRALMLAQRELSAERQHPVYWAPFVIVLSP